MVKSSVMLCCRHLMNEKTVALITVSELVLFVAFLNTDAV